MVDSTGASFDLVPDTLTCIDATINIVSEHAGTPIQNTKVTLNGELQTAISDGEYKLPLNDGDTINIQAPNYATKTIVVDSNFVNYNKRNVTIQMRNTLLSENSKLYKIHYTYNDVDLSDKEIEKITFTVNNKDISSLVASNREIIIGPGDMAYFKYMANLNMKVNCSSKGELSYSYYLTNKSASVKMENGLLYINFEDQYAECVLKAKAKKEYLDVTVMGYDEVYNAWVLISSEFKGTDNCFNLNVSRISKIKAQYSQCNKTIESEETTYTYSSHERGKLYQGYNVTIDKTFWQNVDDFFKGIGNWFKNLFSQIKKPNYFGFFLLYHISFINYTIN